MRFLGVKEFIWSRDETWDLEYLTNISAINAQREI